MSIIIVLILVSLSIALVFLGGFIWAVKSSQYEDILTPSLRVLTEETSPLCPSDLKPTTLKKSKPL